MLKNYFITAIRNLKREKVYAILNVAGLALGIGCALVIFELVSFETSYDKHHLDADKIYRIVRVKQISIGMEHSAGVPHPLREALDADFPDLTSAMTHYNFGSLISIDNGGGNISRYQEDEGTVFAEQDIFNVFSFNFLAGDRENCLSEPNSAVVASSLVQKYFDLDESSVHMALGKTISLDNTIDLKITGVIQDPPKTTDVPFKVIIHYETQGTSNPYYRGGKRWNSTSSRTNCYVRLSPNQTPSSIEGQLPALLEKFAGSKSSENQTYLLQPLAEIHHDIRYGNYSDSQVDMESIITIGIIGIFLIITAAINFVNLATAQAVKRSKEVGIRKAIGGNKAQLIIQFLSETLMITVIAAFLGVVIGELLLVYLEDITGYKLTLNIFSNENTLLFLVGLVVLVGLLSGFYPAIIMSSMDPVSALRNKLNSKVGSGFLSLRRILVVLQFSISQVLIIGTIVVGAQLSFFSDKDLGFNKDAVVITALPENNLPDMNRLKNLLKSNPDIKFASFNLSSPLGNSDAHANIHHESLSPDEEYDVNFKVVDEDYLDLYEIDMLAGRPLHARDSSNSILINDKLAGLLGFQNPEDALGTELTGWRGKSRVVGVVENFHTESLQSEIGYVAMVRQPETFYELAIKMNTKGKSHAQVKTILKYLEQSWLSVFPQYLYDYEFYDERLTGMYEGEESLARLFRMFAIIAIFIGCLGLYGLIAYVANQKTKEIGVRKVLGAPIWSIVNIFSKEMLGLVLVAFVVSAPLAYFALSSWLDDYAYRIEMSPFYFIIAIVSCLLIGVLTVGYKSISTAMANPILSLRDE